MENSNEQNLNKFLDRKVALIGVSVKEGQQKTGVEQTPKLMRDGGLITAIEKIGFTVEDQGNITKEGLMQRIEKEIANETEYKYVLPNIEVIGVMNEELSSQTEKCSKERKFSLTIGGDHGLAFGSIHGLLKTFPDLKVIWIDAHGDCNTPETSPSGNYHGMPVAHLLGWMPKGSVKAFDWVTETLKPENLVYIGLRDLDKGEKEMLKKHKIKVFTPFDIEMKGGIAKVMDETLTYLKAGEEGDAPIHISWDVDGCDPSFIKATGTKSRCGLTERESHYILMRTAKTGNLVSLDMVEVNPELEDEDDEEREILHGDNPLLKGPPTLVYAMEFVLSALGNMWL